MSSSEESGEDDLLPAKSKTKYLLAYDHFKKWKTENNKESFSEKVLLKYFKELSKSRKISSVWAIYSMLKTTLQIKHNIQLNTFFKLLAWLRRKSVGYESTKSKILTEEDIRKFIYEAPDEKYLAAKVALIFGICGGCQANELAFLPINNVKIIDDVIYVQSSKNNCDRIFSIRNEFIPVVKKYLALRPKDINIDRFFMSYRDGSCTKQVIGRHKISAMPKQIATYLKLPNPERYTGRCFKISAAAIDANGANKDKCNKNKIFEVTSNLDEKEIGEEMVKSAERFKSANVKDTGADKEVKNLIEGVPKQTTEAVKVEEIDLLPDEVYIKSEEDGRNEFYSMMNFDNNVPTTSQPSVSDRESRSTDIVVDSDEDDDLEDLVHIRSENVDRKTTLRSLQEETSHEASPHDTKITVAGKNVTILFKNCTNVGNVTVNIINK